MDVVISDLDGTLLDHGTYSFAEAMPALELLQRKRIPVVYCSSKTRKEMEHWRGLTGNEHPFIVENGGAVFVPAGYFPFAIPSAQAQGSYLVMRLGEAYAELVAALQRASQQTGCRVRGFHEMTAAEVGRMCDLPAEAAALAKAREFDEAFVIVDGERTGELLAAIEAEGKHWTRGGRFYHILGRNDKAAAAQAAIDLYRTAAPDLRSIGIGDGVNDAPFLNVVDVPILIRTPWLKELQAAVPRGRPTASPGPRGWNEAVIELLG